MLFYQNDHFEFLARPQVDDAVAVHIVQRHSTFFVCISELGTGMSVTNAIEEIAAEIMYTVLKNTPPSRVIWFEHWPMAMKTSGDTETFDLVTFLWSDKTAREPDWVRIPIETYEDMTGSKLP